LKPAEGAVVIDTTGMPIDVVVAKVFAVVRP
jgi:cytidylate kinase